MLKLLITGGGGSGGTVDATELVPTVTWSGDYQQCARTLEFGVVSTPVDQNIPTVACDLGNGVVLMQDNKVLFDGFIFSRQKGTGNSTINLTCFDRGIYLKRNEGTYKFTNMTPEAIAKRVCTDFGITAGTLVSTGVKLSRNFVGATLFSIIQTSYTLASQTTGKNYMIRFDGAKLCVIEKTVTDETLIIEGGSNLMSASTTESVENMINQVAIYDSNGNLLETQKDSEAIGFYGLLQSYLRQCGFEDGASQAKKMLADNRVSQKLTIENLGNIANIVGGTVVIREPYTSLYGLFYIDSDMHIWKNGLYTNKLVVNFKNIMDKQEAGTLVNKDGTKTGSSGTNTGGGNR